MKRAPAVRGRRSPCRPEAQPAGVETEPEKAPPVVAEVSAPVEPAVAESAPEPVAPDAAALDDAWDDEEQALPLVAKGDRAKGAASSPVAASSPHASESETLYALEASDVNETTGDDADPAIPIVVEGVGTIESRPPPMSDTRTTSAPPSTAAIASKRCSAKAAWASSTAAGTRSSIKLVAIKILRQDVPAGRRS